MAADSLRDPSAEPAVDSSAPVDSPAPAAPVMGERSRQYLRDRREGRLEPEPAAAATYRVPRLPQAEKSPVVSVRNAVIGLHFVGGACWAFSGIAATLSVLGDGTDINHATAALCLAVAVYGCFCVWLGFGLSVTARWAWPAAVAMGGLWCGLLLSGGLLGGGLLLFALLPLAGFNLWALLARKAAFVDSD